MSPVPARTVVPISEGPLGVLDLLDGSFAVLRQRARVIVGTVAGLVLPVALLQAWASRDDLGGSSFGDLLNDPAAGTGTASPFAAYDLLFFLTRGLGLAVTAAGGVAVSRVVVGWLDGHDLSALDALRFTARRLPALAGAFVIVKVLEGVGFLLLGIPGLAAILLCSLTSPVLAIEGLGPVAAVRRSAELVRRRPGPLIGLSLLLFAVQYGVGQAVGTLPGAVAVFVGPDRAWPLLAASNTITSLILVPVNGAAMCLAYLDLRYRTEGLDLSRRIQRHFGPEHVAGPAA